MFIKLQPDQVVLFWEIIRHGLTVAYRIPKDVQQDFAIGTLVSLLSGMSQAWIGYSLDEEGNKRLTGVITSRIVDDMYQGIKYLYIGGTYGYRRISPELYAEGIKALEEFAKANGCKAIVTEYSSRRMKEVVLSAGFEEHVTLVRKVL